MSIVVRSLQQQRYQLRAAPLHHHLSTARAQITQQMNPKQSTVKRATVAPT
jgi:hypothetical protein